jgi:transposase
MVNAILIDCQGYLLFRKQIADIKNKIGLTSKIHCIVDGLGNPIEFILTGGEVHDSVCANELLNGKNANYVVADKAYDSNKILEQISQMNAIAVIPPKSNRIVQRDYDKDYYKDRNLVERFFCRLKQFRGIATRYCKRGQYFLEAVKLASSIILMC